MTAPQVTHEANGFVRIKFEKGLDLTFHTISSDDIHKLSVNPWQMFKPPSERVFSPKLRKRYANAR